jgi:peptidoglycan hydrolase-like protein with peptidoglycan-binding domain
VDLVAAAKIKSHVPTASGLKRGDEGNQVKRLQAYLAKFGYLDSPDLGAFGVPSAKAFAPSPQRDKFDEYTEQALRAFQQRNHLHVTGELDGGARSNANATAAVALITQSRRISCARQPTGYQQSPATVPELHVRLTQAQVRARSLAQM